MKGGELLLAPSGLHEDIPVLHCFFRRKWTVPCASYPVNISEEKRPTAVGVRTCPVKFKVQDPRMISGLTYKAVWAVATRESIILYNNESPTPIGCVSNCHFSTICDVAWLKDRLLAVCSNDGYISFLIFDQDELGERIESEEVRLNAEKVTQSAPTEVFAKRVDGKKRVIPTLIQRTNTED